MRRDPPETETDVRQAVPSEPPPPTLSAELTQWLWAEWNVAVKNGTRFALGQKDKHGWIQNAYVMGARDVIHRLGQRFQSAPSDPPAPQPDTRTPMAHLRGSLPDLPAEDYLQWTKPQTWQSIESAPLGRDVLLLREHGVIIIGDWDDYAVENAPRFTHWMPLPAPPPQETNEPTEALADRFGKRLRKHPTSPVMGFEDQADVVRHFALFTRRTGL